MVYLLDLAYLVLALAALPWLAYQRLRYGKYRQGWLAKLWGAVPPRAGQRPCLWLHAVSVGEVNLLEPLIQRWEARHPQWDVVISTTTQAGYELACRKYAPRTVYYAPLDFSWAVRRAVRRIRPTLLVLAELELWPNLIAAARRRGAAVAVVNGRLSQRSFAGYRRIGWLARRTLRQLDLIAAQNQEYADRFSALGADPQRLKITGSVKFDGARADRAAPHVLHLAELAGLRADDIVWLAGSTQHPEEEIVLEIYRRLAAEFPRLRLILVPRHPQRFEEVARLLARHGLPWQRRSALGDARAAAVLAEAGLARPAAGLDVPAPAAGESIAVRPVLLVDVVGELGWWWGTAQIAFVGGSLTQRGGQNMIEPAAYGVAVAFGPNTWNFRDVVELLLTNEAAVVTPDAAALEAFVRRCVTQPGYAQTLGARARALVLAQQGAADRTVALLESLVPVRRTQAPPAVAVHEQPMGPSFRLAAADSSAPGHPRADLAAPPLPVPHARPVLPTSPPVAAPLPSARPGGAAGS
jgi:3-deoxy-D-manno-octulosonic-acid transferase